MKKRLLLAVPLAAILFGAGYSVLGKRAEVSSRPIAGIPPLVIESRPLAVGEVTLTLPTSAEVVAMREVVLSSRIAAHVAELTRYEGDTFRAGEVLVRLDASQAQADLAGSDARLARDRAQSAALATDVAAAEALTKSETARVERLQALLDIGGVALEQVEAAQAALAAARARLSNARAALDSQQELIRAGVAQARASGEGLRYAELRAPFDGVISQRLAQPGDLATPGKPLLKIIDSSAGTRLLVAVPQPLHPSALWVDGRRLPLRPWPEAADGMTRFEARGLPSPLPGARIAAALEVYRAEAGIVLPRACVADDDGDTAVVLLAEGDEARPTRAKIAARGVEGVALADTTLADATVLCGSLDILARAQAGAALRILPFKP